ncbi:putative ribonuclease H-like domain-containing protein [Tanacetum coccineum]
MTTVGTRAVVNKGKVENVLKKAKWVWRPKMNYQDHVYKYNGSYMLKKFEAIQRSCYRIMQWWIVLLSFLIEVKLFLEILDKMACTAWDFNRTCSFWRSLLVRGFTFKVFVNNHTCVGCKKGKATLGLCKAKLDIIIRNSLELLHMDIFGPVSIESINKKRYCLVVTDDFSRFSWVFFLATKDETSEILCNLIIGLEKQLNHKVKIIRCDNRTEFKNYVMNEFCSKKGIKREFSVARTPQQNGVAERKKQDPN